MPPSVRNFLKEFPKEDKKARISIDNFSIFYYELSNTLDLCVVCIRTRTNRPEARN